MTELLAQTSVVLVEPQNDINIGIAVRAARNFGVSSLRLVNPASADPAVIGVSAPRSSEFIEAIETFESVDAAIADCVFTLGLTARSRSAEWTVLDPTEAASAVQSASGKGRVAILFGREDSGLPNLVLDRCHGVVTIPANPDYTSLNLGQAVLLVLWECFRAQRVGPSPVALSVREEVVSMGRMERLFRHAEEALEAIEFFKTDTRDHIMRSLRSVLLRAGLDERELAIWHGIFREIPAFLRRKGVSGEGDQSSTKQ
jgi:TrmH family RNA methyltransferase